MTQNSMCGLCDEQYDDTNGKENITVADDKGRQKTTIANHICSSADYCTCSMSALEPNERCAVHGAGEWPPRCQYCGRYLPYNNLIPDESPGDVVWADENGTIVLDDGVTTWNPRRAREFLVQEKQGANT